MATFSFGSGISSGAPGTYINEQVGNIAPAGIAPFSTVYMLVEAEEDVPVTQFPFNRPVPVSSLSDYRSLVGGVPESRMALLSYNCVNSFFSNAQVGDLRVVRVGTPNQIVEIEVLPSGLRLNDTGIPSSMQAGETVYIQLLLNNQKLVAGDGSSGYTSDGEWLGVPVVIPVDYIPGDEVNNRRISAEISEAISDAIESNPSIRNSVYVRDFGLVNDLSPNSGSESGYVTIAASSYNGAVNVQAMQELVGGNFVVMTNGYSIENIVGLQNNLERVPQDYIQCINTAFDGQSDQGYLIAPTAYAQFDSEGRAAVGAAAASHSQKNEFKWLALADRGPRLITEVNKYKEYVPHSPTEDRNEGSLYLVDNAIYKWVGGNVTYERAKYQSLVPGFDPEVAVKQSVSLASEDESVGLKDLSRFVLNSTAPIAEYGVFELDNDVVWPVEYQIQEVTLSDLGSDFEDLLPVGENSVELYVVAPPYDSARYGPYASDGTSQYVFLCSTASEAVSVLTEVESLGGTSKVIEAMTAPANCYSVPSPTGSTASATYTTSQWDLNVDIEGQTSNLIRNLSGASSYFNTLHLPGTLQNTTSDFRISFESRTILDPSSTISEASAPGFSGAAQFEIVSHKLVNGQRVYLTEPILAGISVLIKATSKTSLNPYFVRVIDNDNIVLATSSSNYLSGTYIPFPSGSISSLPTILYSTVRGGGLTSVNLSEVSVLPMMRGRKYGVASGTISEEAAVSSSSPSPSGENPTVSIFLNSSSLVTGRERVFPYGEDSEAGWLPKLNLVSPGSSSTTVENFVCTPTVEQSFSSEAFLVPVINPIPGGSYEPNTDPSTGVLSGISDYVDAILDLGDLGTTIQANISNLQGVYFTVIGNDGKAPDGTTDVVIGDRIAVVYNGSSYEWVVVPEESSGGDLSSVARVCYGSQVEIPLTSEKTPPENLWKFEAVTSTEIISDALRGIGFNGEPQAEFVEAGVDNVNRFYEDSQRYFNALGFIAFYGPYVENSSGQMVPASAYVTGIAARRYRSEGFQFPPAGTKYQLADAVGVDLEVNSAQQNLLNPNGCNVLRSLPGYPSTAVFVWGGRTRVNTDVPDQKKFQFVNTRVIQNVVYGSLRNAFDNQVFSVVDGFGVVFNQIVSIGNSVLSQLYTAGALFGRRPSDAFQIICDERINPSEDLENGIVNVKVFDTPVPTLERIELDLIRVSIGQMQRELESQGLG